MGKWRWTVAASVIVLGAGAAASMTAASGGDNPRDDPPHDGVPYRDDDDERRVMLENLMIMSGEPYTQEDIDRELAEEGGYPQTPPQVLAAATACADQGPVHGTDHGVSSRGRGEVFIEYHVALVVDPDRRYVDPDAGMVAGEILASLSGGVGARINTGIHTGTIQYTWEVHAAEPPADESWPEEAQAVIGVPNGRLVLDDMFAMNPDAPIIEVGRPGAWVLRVRYRDRHAEWDSAPEADVAVETFHLDLWPRPCEDR